MQSGRYVLHISKPNSFYSNTFMNTPSSQTVTEPVTI